jgi:hypothetical protein
MKSLLWCILFVCLFLCGTTAKAAIINMIANLDGMQETPSVVTPGVGSATITFDNVSGQMNVSGSFANLLFNANNAHVHGYAPPGTPAVVVFGLTFTASTSGTFSGMGTIPAIRIPDVLNGLTYINVHSTGFPGGEIRGQIVVPEPGTVCLLAGVAIGAIVLRRRFHMRVAA